LKRYRGSYVMPKMPNLKRIRNITLTLDTYSHVLPGMDGAASAMEEALS
jgi:hypothetical protein